MGSWFDHVREYYEATSTLNIHYMKYEDMLKVAIFLLQMDVVFVFIHPSILYHYLRCIPFTIKVRIQR